MKMPTVQKLDRFAVDVLLGIDHLLFDQNIVESIIETYIEFCRSDEARRLDISEIPVTDETRLRLRFECLCFLHSPQVCSHQNTSKKKGGLLNDQTRVLLNYLTVR